MTNPNGTTRIVREARLQWVPIAKMKVNPVAQRDINPARVDRLAASFDLEELGTPTVNERDGWFYIIDGQHRIEMLKQIGWDDQQVQCWCYHGLTEEQEAEKFLNLNDTLTVSAFDKFTKAVAAGRPDECDIDRVVRAQGLVVSRERNTGAVGAVGTLRRVYGRGGPATLARTLRMIREAYGDGGFDAPVIDGIGLLCQRYNGSLADDVAIKKLGNAHGGVNGLLNKAEVIRRQTGSQRAHCVAAAAVEIINSGKGGKKLPNWWTTK